MAQLGTHVLERGSQSTLRGAARIAPLLRREMEARNLSAKELAFEMKAWSAQDPLNRWPVDYRTIQHAAAGTACALDTYLALSGFMGWDFTESVQTPIHGADPLTAREAELESQLTQVAALQARVERDREIRAGAAALKHRAKGGRADEASRAPREARAFAVRSLANAGTAEAANRLTPKDAR